MYSSLVPAHEYISRSITLFEATCFALHKSYLLLQLSRGLALRVGGVSARIVCPVGCSLIQVVTAFVQLKYFDKPNMGCGKCIFHMVLDAATGGLWGMARGLYKAKQMCDDGNQVGGCCKAVVTLSSGGVEDVACEALCGDDLTCYDCVDN